jgi:fermentation-respiration switch protein FrsA (DUF1100 family)
MMNNLFFTLAAALVLLLIAGVGMISFKVGWKLMHPPRKPVDMNPEMFGVNRYEEVTFLSREDGIQLSGWYFSAAANGVPGNGTTLIIAHGYSQNRLEPHLPALSLAAKLLAAGFDVMMFDFRNAGLSGGNITTVGLREQYDLLGAVDYVAQHEPGQRIGLIGFSMGAATSLLAAGQEKRVEAVVADSPFYSLSEYLDENLPNWTGLPRFPFNWIMLTFIPLLLKANVQAVNPAEAVKRFAPKPILFIHGTGDTTIPHGNSERLYRLADRETSELWLVPDAAHVRSYAACPEEYAGRVIRFFTKAMPPGSG